ncbi:hypothetical protein [Demequina soli]|uniref:hypothetical protein n=1 Tax=Demequina soli TaxID=1638987 RepID=UPI000782154E|nr:hypothetical protein [Demequina soli]
MTHFIELPVPLADEVDAGAITVEEIQASVDAAVRRGVVYSAISDSDLDAMLAGSGLPADAQERVRAAHNAPAIATQATLADALAASAALAGALSAQEAAARVGVSVSTITRRHERGELLAMRDTRGRLRLPAWQFTQAGQLAGWGQVATRLDDIDLRTVEAFMVTPDEDLDGDTPLRWLTAGRDPAPVVELVEGLRLW